MKLFDKSLTFTENGKTLTMLSLMLPKFFQDIFQKLLGTVNSAMLATYSDEAVAAISVSNSVLSVLTTLLDAFAFGASILVSLALGKRERQTAGRITFVTLLSTLLFSSAFGIAFYLLAEPVLVMMNAEEATLLLSVEHFRVKAITLPVTVLAAAMSSLLICNGHALFTFLSGVAVSILNLCGTYTVLYGGLDISPVFGIAVSGTLVTAVGLFLRLVIFFVKKCPFALGFTGRDLIALLLHGIPGKTSSFSYTFAQTFTTSFVVSLGTIMVSSKVYIGNITQYVPTLGYAIASAGAILIGRFRGAGNDEKVGALYRRNIVFASCINCVIAILVYIFHRPLVGIFTQDETALSVAGSVFLVDIFVEVFRGINNISDTSLNACGKVKTTLVASAVSCWVFSVGLSYVFGVACGLGLVGIWLAFLADESARAIFYVIIWTRRLRQSDSKKEELPI